MMTLMSAFWRRRETTRGKGKSMKTGSGGISLSAGLLRFFAKSR